MDISKTSLIDNFWEIFHNAIEENTNRDLFVSKYGSLTIGEANHRANIIFNILSEPPYMDEAGVALAFNNQIKLIPAFIGSLKAKKIILCLNFSNPDSRLKYQLSDINIKLILTDSNDYERIHSLGLENLKIINIDELDFSPKITNPKIIIKSSDIVQIIYTSGSTGNPKGTIEDYSYLVRALINRLKENTRNDKISLLKGFSFPGPHFGLLSSILIGSTIYYYDLQKEGVIGFTDWINKSKITHLSITPTLARNYFQTLEPKKQFPYVHTIGLGAEKKLKQDLILLRKFFDEDCKIRLGFASTETNSVSRSIYQLSDTFSNDILPAGKPREDINLLIWDKNFKEVPLGDMGEIVVHGDSLAQGYLNLPELTKEKFIPDPINPAYTYYRSGDLGKILPDGQLMHLGRIDHMVKIKGIRIELESIENHTLSYPGIMQVASRSFDDKRGIQRLATYFIAEEGISIPLSDLRMHLSEKISSQMLPHFFIRMDVFPYTPSGKIDTLKLPIPDMVRPALSYPHEPPSNSLEEKLLFLWEDQLGISEIGVTDNFFDVGGDSLIATLLILNIEKELGRDLPVTTFIKASNIREQAQLLENKNIDSEFKPLIPIREEGNTPPLFFIPGHGGHPTRIFDLANKLDINTPIYAFQENKTRRGFTKKNNIKDRSTEYVKLIKEISPNGPYYLLGESIGGKYIFEMAQQLSILGDEIPILAMLDSSNLNKGNNHQRRKKTGITYFWMLVKKHFTILKNSNWQGKMDYIQYYRLEFGNRIKMQIPEKRSNNPDGLLPKNNPDPYYVAENYHGRVILFKALRGRNSESPANGWDQLELGDLKIHPLDCYHGGVLFDPAVSKVAEILNQYLNELNN